MKCPKCQSQVFEKANFCSQCGKPITREDHAQSRTSSPSDEANMKTIGRVSVVSKAPSGLKRTLSTELVGRQTESPSPLDLNLLVESRTWEPGHVIMQKGEGNRDLLFLIKGHVEISTDPGEGDLVLNEVDAPHILGDIAFLSGLPRTASVMAKTEVKAFVLRYDRFKDLFGRFPEWLQPLLSSFTSGIKSLHYQIAELERQTLAPKKPLD